MIDATFPPLDVECPVCKGEGDYRDLVYEVPPLLKCHECDGHGRVPTAFGRAVLDFVSSRLRFTSEVRR